MTDITLSPWAGTKREREVEFANMAASGIGTLRQYFDVQGLSSGQSPALDEFVIEAASHGIQILPEVIDGTGFVEAAGSSHGFHAPRNMGAFARTAGALAHRYGPNGTLWVGRYASLRRFGIRAWQIWNEPNLPVYWRPRPDPKAYVRLVQAAAAQIHRYEPHATIVSAGIPNSGQSRPYRYDTYIERFLRAGGARYIGTLGVNAYAPDVSRFKFILEKMRTLLLRNHASKLGIWVTELGWADAGPRSSYNVGRTGQADRITDAFKVVVKLRRSYRLKGVVYYEWRDHAPVAGRGDTWGFHTGLTTLAGRPKRSLSAFRLAVRKLL